MSFHPIARTSSIWGSIEMDAASRDFTHADYLNLFEHTYCLARPLSEANYVLVCQILTNSVADDQPTI